MGAGVSEGAPTRAPRESFEREDSAKKPDVFVKKDKSCRKHAINLIDWPLPEAVPSETSDATRVSGDPSRAGP